MYDKVSSASVNTICGWPITLCCGDSSTKTLGSMGSTRGRSTSGGSAGSSFSSLCARKSSKAAQPESSSTAGRQHDSKRVVRVTVDSVAEKGAGLYSGPRLRGLSAEPGRQRPAYFALAAAPGDAQALRDR